jgi:hypothetical protein
MDWGEQESRVMSDHMVFQDCPDWQKEAIKSYWRQKVPRIERLLTRFPEDQRELRLTVTHKPKRFDLRGAAPADRIAGRRGVLRDGP